MLKAFNRSSMDFLDVAVEMQVVEIPVLISHLTDSV